MTTLYFSVCWRYIIRSEVVCQVDSRPSKNCQQPSGSRHHIIIQVLMDFCNIFSAH
jgi:hypothetical protein